MAARSDPGTLGLADEPIPPFDCASCGAAGSVRRSFCDVCEATQSSRSPR